MKLFWRGATRYHDWFDKQRTIPRRMLALAREPGLIGSVEWVSTGPDDERREVESRADTLWELLDYRPKRGELYRIAAGGTKPFSWQLTLGLFPYRKYLKRVQGYNILNLWFESEPFTGSDGSDKLVTAFREIHTPDTTEFAFIHPYERWGELSDTLHGFYGNPVTIGPMFSGVYWANFLGQAHLAQFDLDRLKEIQSYQVEWIDHIGLFLRVSPDISNATSPEVEEEMFRLTNIFRTAIH